MGHVWNSCCKWPQHIAKSTAMLKQTRVATMWTMDGKQKQKLRRTQIEKECVTPRTKNSRLTATQQLRKQINAKKRKAATSGSMEAYLIRFRFQYVSLFQVLRIVPCSRNHVGRRNPAGCPGYYPNTLLQNHIFYRLPCPLRFYIPWPARSILLLLCFSSGFVLFLCPSVTDRGMQCQSSCA